MNDDEESSPVGRENRRANSTIGIAAMLVLAAAVAVWWFEFRDGDDATTTSGYGVVELPSSLNPTGRPPASEVGRAAPDFILSSVKGNDERLSAYRGRWVLLNFWASWCGPCRQETPDLQRLQERRATTLVVLGVNQQESHARAAGFADEYDLVYPLPLDVNGEVSAAYRVGRGLPVSILIDPTGVVRRVHIGRVDEPDLRALEAEFLD